jgi:uncharacterized OB-fold protein
MVITYSDGTKSSKREWIDHIACKKCGKKWFPPTKEEIIKNLKKAKTEI